MKDRYRHKKTGHVVNIVMLAKLQTRFGEGLCDGEVMVVYEHEGEHWVRSKEEFEDGRFEKVQS